MKRAIYQIDNDIHRILSEAGEEGELTPEAIKALDELQLEIVDKIGSILGFIHFVEGWAEMAKQEKQRVAALQAQYVKKVDDVYDYLAKVMKEHNMGRLDHPTAGKVWFAKSPPSAEPLVDLEELAQPVLVPCPGITTTPETTKEITDKYLMTGEVPDGWVLWRFTREKVTVTPDKEAAIEFFKQYGKAPPGWKITADAQHLVIK